MSAVRRHPIITFFVLAYAISWGFLPIEAVRFLPTGPLFAALIVISLTQGLSGLRELGLRMIRWRVRWYWYALVSDRDACGDGDHHACQEVGREVQRLVGGDEDERRHDLRPRVHRDGEGDDSQAHSSDSSCSGFLSGPGWASSGKASTLSSSSPRPFMRSRMPKRCGWSMISPMRIVCPSLVSIFIPSKAAA